MLLNLSIRDIVLIDRLDLELGAGLCVLTGETGAGKSILLDALGLALGRRAGRGLVRQGADQGSVSAVFAQPEDPAVHALLDEHGIGIEDALVLRRVLGSDGRSRAFVNDQPTTGGLLRRLGDLLVEVHGQQEQQALLDPGVQRRLLDAYGRLEQSRAAVADAHRAWRLARDEHDRIAGELARAGSEEAYWRHVLAELDELAPARDEEAALVETRTRLMNRERLARAIGEAMDALRGGVEGRLATAARAVERAAPGAGTLLDPAVAALGRCRIELEESIAALQQAAAELELDEDRLEAVEERLFALRAAARKHRVPVEGLVGLRAEIAERVAGIEAGTDRLAVAGALLREARAAFVTAAERLSGERATTAARLDRAIMAELPPLRLERASFRARLVPLDDEAWSADGAERVAFEIATNPGQAPGPLARIASGGELARLMLALKVVLAQVDATPAVVFDEVDTGIGGATSDAVGERLARLGAAVQVLVVTHAPQVAARADHHYRVAKETRRGRAWVGVARLDAGARREEIARMLAGAEITEAARAAADSLIEQSA